MRQILMNSRGEFSKKSKTDHYRSAAVKMTAKVIKKSKDQSEDKVIISNKAIQRTSR